MPKDDHNHPTLPRRELSADWINQRELAELLGTSPKTASVRAGQGSLRMFEHGLPACGRRKYSRSLVERAVRLGWEAAIRRQDEAASTSKEQ